MSPTGIVIGDIVPLREPTVFILTALARGKLHGYGIMSAVEELSEGRISLSTGTLYGALERLQKDDFVAFAGSESDGGPPRRYYELTESGRKLLQDEVERLRQTAKVLGAELDQAWT